MSAIDEDEESASSSGRRSPLSRNSSSSSSSSNSSTCKKPSRLHQCMDVMPRISRDRNDQDLALDSETIAANRSASHCTIPPLSLAKETNARSDVDARVDEDVDSVLQYLDLLQTKQRKTH